MVHLNYRLLFCKHNGTVAIISFNIRLLNFGKFAEFLKISTIKASLNVFSYFPVWRYA